MDNAVIENGNPGDSAAAPSESRSARLWDLLFALSVPAYFAYLFLVLTRSSLPHIAGAELVPVLWIATRQRRILTFHTPSRLAVAGTAVLVALSVLRCSLPVLEGIPVEQVRYEMSLSLGSLWGPIPYVSLFVGLLSLGPCHLGALAFVDGLGCSETIRTKLHDLYFGASAVVAHLAIVRYAGGPFDI